MKVRVCTKCHEIKTIDNFSKRLTGYSPSCKECYKKYWSASREKRLAQKIKYYHFGNGKKSQQEYARKNRIKISARPYTIYSAIQWRCIKSGKSICSREDFYKWYLEQIKSCFYCNANIEIIEQFGERSKRLTIDRMDNNKGYDLDNICLACEVCNHIKSDVFTVEEMKEIGKFVMNRWNKIINNEKFQEIIK